MILTERADTNVKGPQLHSFSDLYFTFQTPLEQPRKIDFSKKKKKNSIDLQKT